MKIGSVLTSLVVGQLLVRPLADAWRGSQMSSRFHHSGQSMALLSPSIFKEKLGRLIPGLLPPRRGVLQVCQTPLQLTGCLWCFGCLGAQGSWVQGHVVSCNTHDGVYSSARCIAAAYVGTAELTFILLFWVQTVMTAPQQGLGLWCHGAPRFPYGSGETVGTWPLYSWGAEVLSGQETTNMKQKRLLNLSATNTFSIFSSVGNFTCNPHAWKMRRGSDVRQDLRSPSLLPLL